MSLIRHARQAMYTISSPVKDETGCRVHGKRMLDIYC